jgi:hypothetical protein
LFRLPEKKIPLRRLQLAPQNWRAFGADIPTPIPDFIPKGTKIMARAAFDPKPLFPLIWLFAICGI